MSEPYMPVYINGALVPADQALVSAFDRGFMRGDGLFETIRAYNGVPFMLKEHLARLDHGFEVLRFPVKSKDLDLKAAVDETLRASGFNSARIRIQVTRGAGSTEFTTHADTEPTVVVSVQPTVDKPWPSPLKAIVPTIRRDEKSPLASVKTINYVPSLLARMEAEDFKADEAILLNYAGNVAEGCASNVFLVQSGVLMTPDLASGVLRGITRMVLIKIARDFGIPVEEKPISLEVLENADEVFMTSSVREVAPVSMLNGRRVGKGTFEIAERLYKEYRRRAEGQ